MPYVIGSDGALRNNIARAQHIQTGPGYFTDQQNSFGHFYLSTTLSVAGSTWTTVTFNSSQALRMSNSGATVTVTYPGLYALSGFVRFTAAGGSAFAAWRVSSNLQGIIGGDGPDEISTAYVMPKTDGFFSFLSAGEQLTFQVYHTYSSSLTLSAGTTGNMFSVRYL